MTRCLLPLSLVALLVVTSAAMAVARAGMAMGGTVTICFGDRVVTVALGPDGKPATGHPACVDCTMGALALSDAVPPPVRPVRLARLAPTPPRLSVASAFVPVPSARDPPRA
ncbi:hypothetical protein HKCCE2091_07385 [Rhodobacterales bacterium HKCCE2091]|nr:hypothetical protein [Rhodobacterales bacterium HKCCE2091]